MKARPARRLCRAPRYATADLARVALERARKTGARRWFACTECGGFHLEVKGGPPCER